MPIDPYAPCPGGTGKKIKFCCSDLTTELEKIERMLEGDQRAAALEHIESIEARYPDRACLLALKTMAASQLGEQAKVEATVDRFVEKYPDNPVALAEKAMLIATSKGGAAAIGPLQDALERSSEQVPSAVYEAVGVVAQALVLENQLFAARGHLMLQIAMGGAKDQQPLTLLARLNGSQNIPLLAKQDFMLQAPPDDALWKQSANTAVEPSRRGAWRKAAGNLTELAAKAGDWPAIWQNIAVLRTWLADGPGAIHAWRKYAAADIPLVDAVEAESLAQLLDVDAADLVDLVTIEYAVNDQESLEARFAANPRSPRMTIDLARLGTPEEPPPKAAWWLIDRAIPASGKDLALADVPRIVGHAFFYGKQTDRNARIELVAYRTELAQAQATAAEIAGDALGPPGAESVESQTPVAQHLLSWNWRLPDDTPMEHRLALIEQARADALLERWTEMPQKMLGNRSPSRAAGDPKERIKLLASILILELAVEQTAAEFDFNLLRGKLGLPTAEPIVLDASASPNIPLARLARVAVDRLTDEQLLGLYRIADHYRHVAALRKFAHAVIDRQSLDASLDKAEVFGVLAQTEPDSGRAIQYLEEARKRANAARKSTAPWDLAELALRIARGDVAEADRLLHHIRTEHVREPGVAQALFQILAEAGIIGPDGRPTAAAAAAGAEAPGIVVPGAAAAEPGKIWTPGSDAPAGGKKSALWTPGMD